MNIPNPMSEESLLDDSTASDTDWEIPGRGVNFLLRREIDRLRTELEDARRQILDLSSTRDSLQKLRIKIAEQKVHYEKRLRKAKVEAARVKKAHDSFISQITKDMTAVDRKITKSLSK